LNNKIIGEIYIDPDIDSYQNYIDDNQIDDILNVAKDTPKLNKLVTNLLIDWRGAAYTASLSSFVLKHSKSFIEGYVNNKPNSLLIELVEAFTHRCSKEIKDLVNYSSIKEKLASILIKIGDETLQKYEKSSFEFPTEIAWETYLEKHYYQLSIWSSQRLSYLTIYTSYENFITQLMRIALEKPDYKMPKSDDFKNQFRNIFNQELLDKCWNDRNIKITRYARHSLSHVSGEETEELKNFGHNFVMVNNKIQITPNDIKNLFCDTSKAVKELVVKSSTMDKFQ
jgi:hypothetical protein